MVRWVIFLLHMLNLLTPKTMMELMRAKSYIMKALCSFGAEDSVPPGCWCIEAHGHKCMKLNNLVRWLGILMLHR